MGHVLYYGSISFEPVYSVKTSGYDELLVKLTQFLRDWYDYPCLSTVNKPSVNTIIDMAKVLIQEGFTVDFCKPSFGFKLEYQAFHIDQP